VVIPAHGSTHLLKELAKGSKDRELDVMVVGKAEPSEFYLKKNIVLVTNDPNKLYKYLNDSQLLSSSLTRPLF